MRKWLLFKEIVQLQHRFDNVKDHIQGHNMHVSSGTICRDNMLLCWPRTKWLMVAGSTLCQSDCVVTLAPTLWICAAYSAAKISHRC